MRSRRRQRYAQRNRTRRRLSTTRRGRARAAPLEGRPPLTVRPQDAAAEDTKAQEKAGGHQDAGLGTASPRITRPGGRSLC